MQPMIRAWSAWCLGGLGVVGALLSGCSGNPPLVIGQVEGLVQDYAVQEGIAGADVMLYLDDGTLLGETGTDRDGIFDVDIIAEYEGGWELTGEVSHPDYVETAFYQTLYVRDVRGSTVRARPGPYGQGDTISLYVETLDDSLPAGTFLDQTLHFAPYQDGFVALVGVDGFTRPGRHLLTLNTTADPAGGSFSQQVEILSGGFLTQTITVPDTLSYLLAPEVRATEDAFLATFFNQFTETAYWEGIFQRPVSTTLITASYGGARSYNGGPYDIYHTGIDFGGGIGTPIMAPANGVVLFAGPLELRGLSIILDHGLGVMTGYYHLEQMMVAVGDVVPAGQVIGLGGSTGLSTGPHLHWDLRVHNVPVDGQKWLATQFP